MTVIEAWYDTYDKIMTRISVIIYCSQRMIANLNTYVNKATVAKGPQVMQSYKED